MLQHSVANRRFEATHGRVNTTQQPFVVCAALLYTKGFDKPSSAASNSHDRIARGLMIGDARPGRNIEDAAVRQPQQMLRNPKP